MSSAELNVKPGVDEKLLSPEETKPTIGSLSFTYSKNHAVVLTLEEDNLKLNYKDPLSSDVLLEVRRITGAPFALVKVKQDQFDELVTDVYQSSTSQAQQLMEDIGSEDFFTLAEELPTDEDLLETDDDAPIIKLINAMLAEAIKEEASDIHIETYEHSLVIRFRIDGVLCEILKPQRKLAPLLVSRIKVMSKLDIAEKRVPQDGRISLRIGGRAVDVRVSTMPASHGERVVMRLLDKNAIKLDLAALGLARETHLMLQVLINKPHGIILVTGPTGSGKSTTLYAALLEINAKDKNILTVEDPIEYAIDGIGQTQVNNKVDMTFAIGLRAVLRQDPDVVMVGEIRDFETARIAVQASLTGHLVFSTLHTNSAVGAVTRLSDMGIEPFLLSTSLLGVLAQRLVRRLCARCRELHQPTTKELEIIGSLAMHDSTMYRAVGCEKCNMTGYRGRIGIHELLIVTDEIQELIQSGASEIQVARICRLNSASIRDDGIMKVLEGLTTLEEIMRVTREA